MSALAAIAAAEALQRAGHTHPQGKAAAGASGTVPGAAPRDRLTGRRENIRMRRIVETFCDRRKSHSPGIYAVEPFKSVRSQRLSSL